jgi:hypothetical protein
MLQRERRFDRRTALISRASDGGDEHLEWEGITSYLVGRSGKPLIL